MYSVMILMRERDNDHQNPPRLQTLALINGGDWGRKSKVLDFKY
jgi:hypothetical protein